MSNYFFLFFAVEMDTEDSSSSDFEGCHGNDCDNSIDDISAYGDIGNFPQGQGQVNETDSDLDLDDIDLSDVRRFQVGFR